MEAETAGHDGAGPVASGGRGPRHPQAWGPSGEGEGGRARAVQETL
jgi:hypothetical protein